MGLDFSHGDAHWSYSGFHRFRCKLARAINIDLEEMDGFAREPLLGCIVEGKPWPDTEIDPLIALLNHSDCDGELTPDQCKSIAPRLREIVEQFPADDYDRQQALMLADGMDEAVQENELLEFC